MRKKLILRECRALFLFDLRFKSPESFTAVSRPVNTRNWFWYPRIYDYTHSSFIYFVCIIFPASIQRLCGSSMAQGMQGGSDGCSWQGMMQICTCDSNYCNASSRISTSKSLAIVTALFGFIGSLIFCQSLWADIHGSKRVLLGVLNNSQVFFCVFVYFSFFDPLVSFRGSWHPRYKAMSESSSARSWRSFDILCARWAIWVCVPSIRTARSCAFRHQTALWFFCLDQFLPLKNMLRFVGYTVASDRYCVGLVGC